MNRRNLLVLLLALCAIPALAAGEGSPRLTGIYSDLSYNQEGGDLLGMELLIVPAKDDRTNSYTAFVQVAEGGAPYTALVTFKLNGSKFELVLPSGGTYSNEHFSVTVVGTDLVVRWPSGNEERLKRGRSYWQ